jgi:hypothetical protein
MRKRAMERRKSILKLQKMIFSLTSIHSTRLMIKQHEQFKLLKKILQ